MKIFIRLSVLFIILVTFFTIFQFINPKKASATTLKELNNEVSQLSSQEENLVEEILATESLIEIKKNEIKALEVKIGTIENELKELEDQRKALQESLNGKKDQLKRIIIYSYKYGNDNVIKLMVSASNINEFVKTLYIFKNIMKRNAELIEEIRLDKEQYDRILRKSEENRKQLQVTEDEKQSEQKKLEVTLKKDNTLAEQVKGERQSVQKTLADIKQRIAEIQPSGVILTGEWKMVATAYFSGGDGITATGLRARKGVVAVDPRVIPLGTKLYIEGYGEAQAADTGGWIKGNRIDLCFDSLQECMVYGRRNIYIYLVEN
jgi:3D (Asp-Asp-Asp) domain-containing protein/septal ring factor EnvC (AmiA/AmiB activator)